MKKTIETSHKLNANPEKVWKTISKASGVDDWLPIITSCKLDGDKRICATEQGDLKETILEIDDKNRTFTYAIDQQPLLPIQNIVATMKVFSKNEGAELSWNINFDIEDENQLHMVEEAVQGLYSAGAEGLERVSR